MQSCSHKLMQPGNQKEHFPACGASSYMWASLAGPLYQICLQFMPAESAITERSTCVCLSSSKHDFTVQDLQLHFSSQSCIKPVPWFGLAWPKKYHLEICSNWRGVRCILPEKKKHELSDPSGSQASCIGIINAFLSGVMLDNLVKYAKYSKHQR